MSNDSTRRRIVVSGDPHHSNGEKRVFLFYLPKNNAGEFQIRKNHGESQSIRVTPPLADQC